MECWRRVKGEVVKEGRVYLGRCNAGRRLVGRHEVRLRGWLIPELEIKSALYIVVDTDFVGLRVRVEGTVGRWILSRDKEVGKLSRSVEIDFALDHDSAVG